MILQFYAIQIYVDQLLVYSLYAICTVSDAIFVVIFSAPSANLKVRGPTASFIYLLLDQIKKGNSRDNIHFVSHRIESESECVTEKRRRTERITREQYIANGN